MIRDFDFSYFVIGFLVFIIGICAIIFVFSKCRDMVEEDCVNFYKDNHYILKSCEVYKDKLENID